MRRRPIVGIACTCLMKAMIDRVAADESICGTSYDIVLSEFWRLLALCEFLLVPVRYVLGHNTCCEGNCESEPEQGRANRTAHGHVIDP